LFVDFTVIGVDSLNIDLVSIRKEFLKEAAEFDRTVWMTIVDTSNEVMLVAHQQYKNQKNINYKVASLKMAITANNMHVPTGFEMFKNKGQQKSQLERIILTPRAHFDKLETVAIGGLPILTTPTCCIGGLGISGLSDKENFNIATTLIKNSGFCLDDIWLPALESANLVRC
jgi:uncharacterized protein GlcG (DUF336 family)